jgi:hypothetical protein
MPSVQEGQIRAAKADAIVNFALSCQNKQRNAVLRSCCAE